MTEDVVKRRRKALDRAQELYEKPLIAAPNLTPSFIELAAKLELMQAMDTPDRLVAFIGAGASVAYGQVDWNTLVDNIKDTALAYRDQKRGPLDRQNELSELSDALDTIEFGQSAENKILAMEIADRMIEILWDELTEDKRTRIRSLRDIICAETDSWRAFVDNRTGIITEAIREFVSEQQIEEIEKKLLGSNRLFKTKHIFKESKETIDSNILPVRNYTDEFISKTNQWIGLYGRASPIFVHQDLVLLILYFVLIGIKAKFPRKGAEKKLSHELSEQIDRILATQVSELSVTPNELPYFHDPIKSLRDNLGTKRFITTNYDREIEKFFERIGYEFEDIERDGKQPDNGSSPSTICGWDGGGAKVRSSVLTEQSVADLMEFATDAGQVSVDIFHLHGRNDLPQTIIATERDYLQTYLRNDLQRQLFKEALDVVFGANVILFVGLGMSEAELLRPLRKYLSELPESASRCSFIVLMPRWSTDALLDSQQQLSLKVRYGVETLLYGGDHLAEALEAIQTLRSILPIKGKKRLDRKAISKLEERDKGKRTGQPIKLSCHDDWKGLEAHIAGLNMLIKLGTDGWLTEKFPEDADEDAEDAHDGTDKLLHQFLAGAEARLITASLCAYLRELRGMSHDDIQIRRIPPMPRDSQFPIKPDSRKSARPKSEAVAIRHKIVQSKTGPARNGLFFKRAQLRFDALRSVVGTISTSLRAKTKADYQKTRRRRIFIVFGDRGVGRGRTFWRLHDRDFEENRLRKDGKPYRFAYSATTNFSWEFASTFDKLTDFIADGQFRDEVLSRRMRLRAAIDHARKTWTSEDDRHLFVLNGVEALLDEEGYPFGDEYAELFPILLGPKAKYVPIDIFLLIQKNDSCAEFIKRCLQGEDAAASSSDDDGEWDEIESLIDHPVSIGASTGATWPHDLSKHDPIACAKKHAIVAMNLEPVDLPENPWEEKDSGIDIDLERLLPTSGSAQTRSSSARSKLDDAQGTFEHAATDKAGSAQALYGAIREFRHATRGHAFLWSIVEAAMAWLCRKRREAEDSAFPSDDAHTWLNDLCHQLVRHDQAKRTEICINAVIELHERNQPVATSRLMISILRHLTIIAIPVEDLVLHHCPELLQIVRKDLGRHADPQEVKKTINDCLKELVDLRLIFQLDNPNFDVEGSFFGPGEAWPRFSVHRLTQSAILKRMGCPRLEGGETNFFQATLYAAQPKDLPSLNRNSYAFISTMVDALIKVRPNVLMKIGDERGALENLSDDDRRTAWSETDRAARCHRAAFGAIRASWSLGVLSRLLEETEDIGANGEGLLQAYKLRNQALIDKAKADDFAYRTLGESEGGVDGPSTRALYRDEIVWIYNEIGVTALTQGRPAEALSFFELAIEENNRIEHTPENATWARVSVNAAMAFIDTGELRVARQLLVRIKAYEHHRARTIGRGVDKDDKGDNASLVATLADGYLALIHHLSGRLNEADLIYKRVIKRLSRLERYRAVAIFCRHRSTLKAREKNFDMAKSLISRSIRAAQAGRHQDILHLSRVNQGALEVENQGQVGNPDSWMRSAERYADYMDIPKLKVEVLFNRGRVFLNRGETKVAGESATKALALASASGMTLHKISAMVLLGEVTLERGNLDAARQIFITAQRLSENIGYHLKGETAYQILLRKGLHPRHQQPNP